MAASAPPPPHPRADPTQQTHREQPDVRWVTRSLPHACQHADLANAVAGGHVRYQSKRLVDRHGHDHVPLSAIQLERAPLVHLADAAAPHLHTLNVANSTVNGEAPRTAGTGGGGSDHTYDSCVSLQQRRRLAQQQLQAATATNVAEETLDVWPVEQRRISRPNGGDTAVKGAGT